ncbi:MAG: DMT family transporter [Bacteroidales bacterium]|nr:DMT family transporter [Bacteroidales bacterium]
MRKSKLFTYLLLILSVIFWGLSFIMTKELFLTEEHMSVTLLIFLRLAIASAVMLPTMALARKLPRLRKGDLKWFLLLTLCEPFFYHLCETTGLQLVSGSLASMVIATIPLFVPFGMWVAYRERLHPLMLLGVALSLSGVALTLLGGEGFSGNLRGLLFLAGAVGIAVVYTLLLIKVVDHYNPLAITTWQNFIGLLYFLPLVLTMDRANLVQLSFSPRMLGLLLTLGIACSTLAYAFYNYGVRRLGASQACIFNNAIPAFSLVAAVLIGQEDFSWSKAVGILVVIGGVVVAQLAPSRRQGGGGPDSELTRS